jgi:hypothetical protein
MVNFAQVVARELLAQYTTQYEENPLFGLLQSWTAPVFDKLRTRYALPRMSWLPTFRDLF